MTSVAELQLAVDVDAWRDIGLSVTDAVAMVGGVCLRFVAPASTPEANREAMPGWMLAGAPDRTVHDVDGIPTAHGKPPEPGDPRDHLLRPLGIDHVVVLTPSLGRTSGRIESLLHSPLKRVRDAGGGVRQGFHRLGEVIVEVVEQPSMPEGPARLWGLVLNVEDLHDVATRLGPDVVSAPKPAVQAGRLISSFRPSAGLGTRVALMTP